MRSVSSPCGGFTNCNSAITMRTAHCPLGLDIVSACTNRPLNWESLHVMATSSCMTARHPFSSRLAKMVGVSDSMMHVIWCPRSSSCARCALRLPSWPKFTPSNRTRDSLPLVETSSSCCQYSGRSRRVCLSGYGATVGVDPLGAPCSALFQSLHCCEVQVFQDGRCDHVESWDQSHSCHSVHHASDEATASWRPHLVSQYAEEYMFSESGVSILTAPPT